MELETSTFACDTWSLILREAHRPRVFKNGVLRKIVGPERDEVMGEWKRLYSEYLYDVHCSTNVI
jgi:hypothetical protein